MNILYRACGSKNGYQSRVIEKLRNHPVVLKAGGITKVTIVTQTLDDVDYYPTDFYHEIPANVGYHSSYEDICDFDLFPAISANILWGLLPYKDFALNMTGRYLNAPIYNYEEMESDYLKHVRFWNHILDTDGIDMIFLSVIPHTPWEYIIYALARVRKIPVLMIDISNISGLNVVGTSIERIGHNVRKIYEKDRNTTLKMDERLYNSYRAIKDNDGKETKEYYYAPKDQKKHKDDYEKWVYEYFIKNLFSNINQYRKQIIKDILKLDKDSLVKDKKQYSKYLYTYKKYRLYASQKKRLEYYQSKAHKPDFSQKYVFYAMHMTPEASTLPYAGVFANQLLAIRILAQAAEKHGVKVYVKEHYMQLDRSNEFYEELINMNNVELISAYESSLVLIDNAVAVASLTGTCMIEAMVRGKPTMGFVDFYLNGAPGFFLVGSVKEAEEAIERILKSDIKISSDESYFYYSVIGKTMVRGYLDYPDYSETIYSEEECIDDTIDVICQFIESGMSEDFCYCKK